MPKKSYYNISSAATEMRPFHGYKRFISASDRKAVSGSLIVTTGGAVSGIVVAQLWPRPSTARSKRKSSIGNIPGAEGEANFYAALERHDCANESK
jgi:hypothetical protein